MFRALTCILACLPLVSHGFRPIVSPLARVTPPPPEHVRNAREFATVTYAVDLALYGPVSGNACQQLTRALIDADRRARDADNGTAISLRIQSGGGEVVPALFVCDVIEGISTPVHTYVEGVAASAASLISVCGAERWISPRGTMLIHQLSGSVDGGTYQQLIDRFGLLRANSEHIARVYAQRTHLSPGDVRNALARDIWLDPAQCVRAGLVDRMGLLT